jgi:glycosyltransferase involved in cell wall biosynthesis
MKEVFTSAGIPSEKIVVIPNFVDPVPEQEEWEEGDYILFFGRLSIEKGLTVLIKAMRHFPETRLLMAGSGPERYHLEALCRKLEVTNVDFLGRQSSEETESLIKRSLFTIISSIGGENCPLSVLESMAFGKPVIGSRIGGIPDLIDDGKDGFLFDPNDETDLCKKIEAMLGDTEYRRELGRNAYKKIERDFNGEVHYQRVYSVYNDLCRTS